MNTVLDSTKNGIHELWKIRTVVYPKGKPRVSRFHRDSIHGFRNVRVNIANPELISGNVSCIEGKGCLNRAKEDRDEYTV
jgi:hypothetical protein